MMWSVHVARIVEDMSAFKILTGKPKVKRPLKRPRRRWPVVHGAIGKAKEAGCYYGGAAPVRFLSLKCHISHICWIIMKMILG